MRQGARGFTLLELVVAIAIFGIMSALAYGGLMQLLDSRDAAGSRAARLTQLQTALSLLDRDIGQLVPRPVRDSYGTAQPALRGGGKEGLILELTRGGWRNPADRPRGSLQRVAYRLSDGGLTRLASTVLDGVDETAGAGATTLLDGVRSVELRFLDGQRQWQPAWPMDSSRDGAALPQAIEVVIELSDWGRVTRLFQCVEG